jgi:IS30 family transposase
LPAVADRLAAQRLRRPRGRRVDQDGELRKDDLLGQRWSPEQVAQELRLLFPAEPDKHLCAESIYQSIYDPEVAVTRPAKRRRRRRRRRRVQGLERRGRLTAMTMISERPADTDDRVRVGHWEGDGIMGAARRDRDRHAGRTAHPLPGGFE